MTAQVATVRHNASVPVNCQIARIEATTATTMQVVVIQNATASTTRGFRNPFGGCRGDSGVLAIRTASVAGAVGAVHALRKSADGKPQLADPSPP
jgi:hypothetical protein